MWYKISMLRYALSLTALALFQPPAAGPGPLAGLSDPHETHFKNVRQLTFGGENAEAYWSFDGKKLIFQHKDGQADADQIYTMNADGTERKLVSTGTGRCTCSYFLKNGKEIIFASTHGYSTAIPPEPDRSQGYTWPIYPYFAIYKANIDGSNLKPLFPKTVEAGKSFSYNAEATVRPDGKSRFGA